MNSSAAPPIDRIRSREWFLPLAIITSLIYALGFLALDPIGNARARVICFPFVWFWAWRSGALAGVTASVIGYLALLDVMYWLVEFPKPDASVTFLVINMCVGLILGRSITMGRRLRVELERSARAEALVRESEECYRVLFDANPIPIWVTDHETMRFLAYNSAAVEHYGYSPAELDQMGLTSFLPPGEVARPDLPGTYRLIKKNETIIDVQVAVHPIRFRGREARLVLATDVTERNRAQALLEHRAHHDMLTGLPNRLAFRSSLERAVEGVGRSVMPFGVLLIDLDRFKEINDTMGHAYGDQALQQVGPRLNEVLRNGDVLARLGGDEFGIYLPNVDADGASQAAARLLEAFREPFVLDGRAFDLGLSIGIAIHPDDGDEVETLMHRADLAMYVAKRSRGGAVLHADTHRPGEPLPLAGRVAENGRHEVVR